MCEVMGVSRSGYYAWLKNSNDINSYMNLKDQQDKRDFELILQAYKFKGINKGSRSIHMRLLHTGIKMNRKKIQRLMRKYYLFCPIRKANPYRRMAKAMKTSNYADNILNRQFDIYGPGHVLLTDITYLYYGNGKSKAYLSTIKDGFTKQILSFKLSKSLEVDFVLDTVNDLLIKHGSTLNTDVLIHSDQGCHYTSYSFIQLLKDKNIRQSMSRRGNCWDNAPQESFFGHMKDEIGNKVKSSSSFIELQSLIDEYMDYYNNYRYQYNLAKLSPNQYHQYYLSGMYPLENITQVPISIKEKFKLINRNVSSHQLISPFPNEENLVPQNI